MSLVPVPDTSNWFGTFGEGGVVCIHVDHVGVRKTGTLSVPRIIDYVFVSLVLGGPHKVIWTYTRQLSTTRSYKLPWLNRGLKKKRCFLGVTT